jgi:hypothetical protein
MFRLAAVESRCLGCTDLRSNPTMRRGHRGRLVEREQKAESHLVTRLCFSGAFDLIHSRRFGRST